MSTAVGLFIWFSQITEALSLALRQRLSQSPQMPASRHTNLVSEVRNLCAAVAEPSLQCREILDAWEGIEALIVSATISRQMDRYLKAGLPRFVVETIAGVFEADSESLERMNELEVCGACV